MLCSGLAVLAARCFLDRADARCQSFENRLQVVKGRLVAADHHAVTAVQTPDTAAGAHVNVANAFASHGLGAAHVVLVIGVATINDGVAGREHLAELRHGGFGNGARGQHDPDRARRRHLGHQVRHVGAGRGAFTGQLFHACRIGVKHHAAVPTAHEAPHDISTHPTQADHSELHDDSFN